MDCVRLHELLDLYLADRLEPRLTAELEAHAHSCTECRDVMATLGEIDSILADELVIKPVLASTSGRSCSRVQGVLAGDPEAGERDRVWAREHLEGCAHCRAVAGVLADLPAVLSTLAVVDPGPDFTADVLLATLPRPSLWAIFLRRVRDYVERWQGREQFAQEFAFAMTVVLVLTVVVPGSPLSGLPQQALSVVRTVGVVGPVEDRSGEILRNRGTVGGELRQGLQARGECLGAGFDRLGSHLLGTGKGLVEGDLGRVEENAGQIGCDFRRLWGGVRAPALDPDSICG